MTDESKKKRNKIIIIVSITIGALLVNYFAGGLIATSIVNETIINKRGSDSESINDLTYSYQKVQRDYPLMAPREKLTFSCGKETLQGYFYEVENPHGVVISSHGVNSQADGNNAQYQNYFIEKGWDVFSFDSTGCGLSSGKGMKTLYESRYCVKSAIEFVQNYSKTQGLSICLVGHSWGAYGVVTASGDLPVSAVCSFSGYDKPSEMMYSFAASYVSPALIVTKPALDFSLSLLQGQNAFTSASGVIKKSSQTKYVIVQGDKDETVPLNKYSIYDNIVNKKLDNVTCYLLEGFGHITPWKSKDANDYCNNVIKPQLDELNEKYNNYIPSSERNKFLSTVDKEKSSALNYELLDSINNIFLKSI